MAEGSLRNLAEGEYLLRRGEMTGDIFWVESGRFEVVDGRQSPETVLEVLGVGRIVGEMSFVDQAPRVADVRAMEASSVHHWPLAVLTRMLETDQSFSARFFRALSISATERLRNADQLVVGARGAPSSNARRRTAAVAEEARNLARAPRSVWTAEEDAIDDGMGADRKAAVEQSIRDLSAAMNAWLSNISSLAIAKDAGAALRGELRPIVVKSRIGQLGMERRTGRGSRSRFLAHLLMDSPQGTDAIGERLDAGLMALPTPEGLRTRTRVAVDQALQSLPSDRPARVALLQPNCGALLARLMPHLAKNGAEVIVVDGDSTVLAFADAGLPARPAEVKISTVRADLSGLTSPVLCDRMDAVIVDGLIDHLPARQVGAVLGMLRSCLAENGRLIATAMGPASDARLMEHLLNWPLMRRQADELSGLFAAAGLKPKTVLGEPEVDHCGLVLVATRSDVQQD